MKTPLTRLALLALLLVERLLTGSTAGAAVHNLATDWSNLRNPFGVWELRKSPTLPFTTNITWGAGQRGWADAPNLGPPALEVVNPQDDHVPVWMKVSGHEFGGNVAPGDVLAHGAELDRTGTNLTSVVWTSPVAGVAIISGGVWPITTFNRVMTWQLLRNGVVLSQGTLTTNGTATYTRQAPFSFAAGSAGAAVLMQTVAVGDQLELRFRSDSFRGNLGDFLNVDLTITTDQPPAPIGLSNHCHGGRLAACALDPRRRPRPAPVSNLARATEGSPIGLAQRHPTGHSESRPSGARRLGRFNAVSRARGRALAPWEDWTGRI